MHGHDCRQMYGSFGRSRGFSRHHHHGGGRERMFDQGELRFVVLALIAEAPTHGYELIKRIEERLGGAYSPSPGVIYPTLQLLEEMGCIAPVPDGERKRYAITEAGQALLAENRAQVDEILARMAGIGGRAGEAASTAPVIRAMENLKTALRMRLARGPLTDEQARRIAAAIDRAATETETE